MKVSELIEQLKEMPQDYEITIYDEYCDYLNASIKKISISETKKTVNMLISEH